MQDKMYLLSIAELLGGTEGEIIMAQAMDKVDEDRRIKAERIKRQSAKAACVGAGLLLQVAVRDMLEQICKKKPMIEGRKASPDLHSDLPQYSVQELLEQIESPILLEYTYGQNGKPYFKEYPFHFNLSHSGEFVVCVVSEREVGVDIQEHRNGNVERIANRYFTAEERKTLEECEPAGQRQMFFDLWATKEAYGKYTGEGIVESLEKKIPASKVELQIIHSIPGYSLAVCKGKDGTLEEMRKL